MVMVMVIATIKHKFNSDGNDDDGDDIDNDDGGVWFALLWRGWLKIFQNNSQGSGGLVAVGQVALCVDWFTLLWRGWLRL
jgi:hypothetical protein